MAEQAYINATGRRKSSVARVRLFPTGDGTIQVNDRTMEEYFPRDTLRSAVQLPLKIVDRLKNVSVYCNVNGGGVSAQASAVAHGISRALMKWNSELRSPLKKEGLVTRDPREKERKKYGRKKARKRFQFSKR